MLKKINKQHEGELEVQKKRLVPDEVGEMVEEITSTEIPYYNTGFFQGLKYLPISTLDSEGFPCTTILSSPQISIKGQYIHIKATFPPGDLFVSALEHDNNKDKKNSLFAALGIDFNNRRRNKLSGILEHYFIDKNTIELKLISNEYLGNCPKYITIRKLVSKTRQPQKPIETVKFDEYSLKMLNNTSTIFLSTRHFSKIQQEIDMGLNHRGGSPGFVRYYEDKKNAFLVIPDYSGNRFYQSLGNIESDKVAGIVIPNFVNGDILYCIGMAENLFNQEAEDIMPTITLLTRIKLTKTVLIKQGLNLELSSPEYLSPYNPPIKLLKSEMKNISLLKNKEKVKLISKESKTENITKFTFACEKSFDLLPGGYAILDFSDYFVKQYRHMNDKNPTFLNDSLVRTWTVSSKNQNEFSLTIKKIGRISTFLNSLKFNSEIGLLGFGGDFSCFQGEIPKKMIWFAGGIGITPFLSMHQELKKLNIQSDIILYYSCRGDEYRLVEHFKDDIKFRIFDSSLKENSDEKWNRRLNENDILNILDLKERQIYVCGPVNYMKNVTSWCEKIVDAKNIHTEKYDF
eukprot:gene8288-112_t